MTADEILARAAELVEASWGQAPHDALNYERGPYCAGIAIQVAAAGQLCGDVDAAWTAIIREIGGEYLLDIAEWNDAPGRCKEEVATALRNAKRHVRGDAR